MDGAAGVGCADGGGDAHMSTVVWLVAMVALPSTFILTLKLPSLLIILSSLVLCGIGSEKAKSGGGGDVDGAVAKCTGEEVAAADSAARSPSSLFFSWNLAALWLSRSVFRLDFPLDFDFGLALTLSLVSFFETKWASPGWPR